MSNRSIFTRIVCGDEKKDSIQYNAPLYGGKNDYRNVRRAELTRALAVMTDSTPLQSFTRRNVRMDHEGLLPDGGNPDGKRKAVDKSNMTIQVVRHQTGMDMQLTEICDGVKKYQQ